MGIQLVFNDYKAIVYKCFYFSKSEDQCSAVMMQAAKETFENKLDHMETTKTLPTLTNTKGNAQYRRQCIIFCRSSISKASFQEFTLKTQICQRNDHAICVVKER